MPAPATVEVAGEVLSLDPSVPFSFGRADSCSAVLDPDDLGISRLAGELVADGDHWWLVNRSTSRPVELVDDLGFRHVVPPGRRIVVEGEATVVVVGSIRRHALRVHLEVDGPDGHEVPGEPDEARATAMGEGVVVNHADRQALVALFDGYLRPFPRHDPNPRTYSDAAIALGWPRTTLVKRIEHLRTRLTDAGVPNLQGDNALRALAEHAIATRLITRDDLGLIDD